MPYLLALTLLFTPAYTIKFSIFGLPTNLLMAWVVLVWVVFALWIVAKNKLADFWKSVVSMDKKILILTVLFFAAGTASLFVFGINQAKLGQYIVLFLQPISMFFIGRFIIQQFPKTRNLLLVTCYLLLAAAGIYAVFQYFTLIGIPPKWWGNSNEPKRALSFFSHPNFLALFSAPLLAFLLSDLGLKKDLRKNIGYIIAWAAGAIGLFLSMSRAGWLGLGTAVLIYLITAAEAKIRKLFFAAAVVGVIIVAITPNLRYRFILPFYGEKSAVSRFSLWHTGWKGIKQSPATGLGLTGFGQHWTTLNTDPGLASDTHNFPHNIFLDFWVETGLLGLISFVGIVSIFIYRGVKDRKNTVALGISLFLIAMLFQGLIDNPYFKNDLAMLFWLTLSWAI